MLNYINGSGSLYFSDKFLSLIILPFLILLINEGKYVDLFVEWHSVSLIILCKAESAKGIQTPYSIRNKFFILTKN